MRSQKIETENLLMLAPGDILVTKDSNARFGLLPANVLDLRNKIVNAGQVNTPIEVEEIPEADRKTSGGFHYRLTVGHTRYAAVLSIHNDLKQTDILLPARVVPVEDEKDRLLRQISENHDRASFTPMDEAHAMQKMLDMDFSRQDVRNKFTVIGGPGKSLEPRPCSNSYLNLTLGFLEYPKKIQNLIHAGLITKDAAYDFAKYDKTEWQSIADKLVEARDKREAKEMESDSKLDEKAKATAEVLAAADTVKEALKAAEAKVAESDKARATLIKEEETAMKAARSTKDPAKAKEAEAAYKAATKAVEVAKAQAKANEKAAEALRKKAALVAEKLKKQAEASKAKVTTKREVADAAADAGAARQGTAPQMSVKELRELVADIRKPCGMPKADAVLQAFGLMFDGNLKLNKFVGVLMKATGEASLVTKKTAA